MIKISYAICLEIVRSNEFRRADTTHSQDRDGVE